MSDLYSKVMKILNDRQSYSDGFEQKLLDIINNCKDYKLTSPMLSNSIIDWPSTYHLSLTRCNLLAPLKIVPGMKILDVGGGTGLLTEFLASKGAHVTLLEGELSRAKVAELRCARFENVEIIVGGVEDYDTQNKYDLVLIVGVLEYIGRENSKSWLKKIKDYLKDDGCVALAIENKLGLKYFIGFPEDHTGAYFDGIEDYSGKDTPRTYSKKELEELFNEIGLPNKKWFYPFPDYKLPTSILADSVFDNKSISDQTDLIKEPFSETGNKQILNLNHRRIIRNINNAGLLQDLANSFFIFAGSGQLDKIVDKNCEVYLLDQNYRLPEFRKIKKLVPKEGGTWNISSQFEEITNVNREIVLNFGSTKYIKGTNYFQVIEHLFYFNSIEYELAIENLIRFVMSLPTVKYNSKSKTISSECELHLKNMIDVSADNLVYQNGHLELVDHEWIMPNGACSDFVILRSLYSTFIKFKSHGNYPCLWEHMIGEFVRCLGRLPHFTIHKFIDLEIQFMKDTHLPRYVFDESTLMHILLRNIIHDPKKLLPFNLEHATYISSFLPNIEIERAQQSSWWQTYRAVAIKKLRVLRQKVIGLRIFKLFK